MRYLLLFFLPLQLCNLALGDELLIGQTTFSFTRTETGITLSVKSGSLGGGSAEVDTTLLTNPDRLVIDLSPPLPALNGRYRLNDKECPTLRLGTDSTRTRIVIDCSGLAPGKFEVEKAPSEIRISYSGRILSAKSQPTTTTTTTTTTTSTLTDGVNRLSRIFFKANALYLELAERTDYTLLKGNEALLFLPKVKLSGAHLALEHFPISSAHGFLAVIPSENERGVSVRLLHEPGYELRPTWQEQTLRIDAIMIPSAR